MDIQSEEFKKAVREFPSETLGLVLFLAGFVCSTPFSLPVRLVAATLFAAFGAYLGKRLGAWIIVVTGENVIRHPPATGVVECSIAQEEQLKGLRFIIVVLSIALLLCALLVSSVLVRLIIIVSVLAVPLAIFLFVFVGMSIRALIRAYRILDAFHHHLNPPVMWVP